MARYINADMLDDVVQDFNTSHDIHITRYEYKRIEELLFCFPTADVVGRKRGKWIDTVIPSDYGGLPVQVCDQCNTFFPLANTGGGHHFCPNCGARMEGEENG